MHKCVFGVWSCFLEIKDKVKKERNPSDFHDLSVCLGSGFLGYLLVCAAVPG